MPEETSLALNLTGVCWAGFPNLEPVLYFIFHFSPSGTGMSLMIILCLSHQRLLGEISCSFGINGPQKMFMS